MRLGTSLQPSHQKCAIVLQWSHTCNHYQVNNCQVPQQTSKMGHVAMNGLWGGRYEKTYLDVRVFNPFAPSNRHSNQSKSYRKHENEKKREYEQRILNIEHATFSPIVMSCFEGLGHIATSTCKHLASLMAEKWNQAYSPTMSWLQCRLSFSLLRSSIQALIYMVHVLPLDKPFIQPPQSTVLSQSHS